MAANLHRLKGLVHSERVLLALTQHGMSRENAYRAVQRSAAAVWRGETDFRSALAADAEVAGVLTDATIAALFDEAHYFRHVDYVFERVFADGA